MVLFEKSFQDLDWHTLEGEDEDQKGTKTLIVPMVREREPKEASLEDLKAQISSGGKHKTYRPR